MPVVTRERFEQGERYESVRDRVIAGDGLVAEMMEQGEAAAQTADLDLGAFTALAEPLKVLVLSEDWCGDCTDNLPILHRIAEETGKLDVRILARDENLDLSDRYLKEGKFRSIPLIIFLDDAFNEIGHLIERPDSVTNARKDERIAYLTNRPELGGVSTPPDELSDEQRQLRSDAEGAMRDAMRPWLVQEVVKALGEIVSSSNNNRANA